MDKVTAINKIKMIVAKMFEASDVEPFVRNLHLSFELMNLGSSTPGAILDILIGMAGSGSMLANEISNGYPVAHLIRTACLMASPEHAEKIGDLLLSQDILSDGRARRGPLVRALGRVGNLEAVGLLERYQQVAVLKKYDDVQLNINHYQGMEFPDSGSDTIYGCQLQEQDQLEIQEAIEAIKKRTLSRKK